MELIAEWMNLIMSRGQGRAPDIYRPFNYIWIIRSCAFWIIFFLFFWVWTAAAMSEGFVRNRIRRTGMRLRCCVICRVPHFHFVDAWAISGTRILFNWRHFRGRTFFRKIGRWRCWNFREFLKNFTEIFWRIFSLIFIDMQIESHPPPRQMVSMKRLKKLEAPSLFFCWKNSNLAPNPMGSGWAFVTWTAHFCDIFHSFDPLGAAVRLILFLSVGGGGGVNQIFALGWR